VILGGSTAVLGELKDGALLMKITGEAGADFLESVLGPEYGSLLPLLVSGSALFLVSRLFSRESKS
jgi:hypothetical protein